MITSKSNTLYKKIKSLQKKKYREIEGAYIIEGKKLLEEAQRSNVEILHLITDERFFYEGATVFSNALFKELSYMENSEGILAVVKKKQNFQLHDQILFLENINDPGNLGTILRTAEAFGFQSVILSHSSCDIYNAKVVRASMGSLFRLHITYENLDILDDLKDYKKIATSLENTSKSIYESVPGSKMILIIGNEHNGITEEMKQYVDEFVIIPMQGENESLNVGIAAAIAMFYYAKGN